MDLEKIRLSLGIAYIKELRAMIKDYPDTDECISIVRSWVNDPHSIWIDIKSDKKIVGFLVLGFPPNSRKGFDWYLQESYISPEYRGKGLMTKVIKSQFKNVKGKYCMYVLDGNHNASNFWHKTIPKLGGKWIDGMYGVREGNCLFYGFEV